jgi:hypothetical protein
MCKLPPEKPSVTTGFFASACSLADAQIQRRQNQLNGGLFLLPSNRDMALGESGCLMCELLPENPA